MHLDGVRKEPQKAHRAVGRQVVAEREDLYWGVSWDGSNP